jgi:hypothetical protein
LYNEKSIKCSACERASSRKFFTAQESIEAKKSSQTLLLCCCVFMERNENCTFDKNVNLKLLSANREKRVVLLGQVNRESRAEENIYFIRLPSRNGNLVNVLLLLLIE